MLALSAQDTVYKDLQMKEQLVAANERVDAAEKVAKTFKNDKA